MRRHTRFCCDWSSECALPICPGIDRIRGVFDYERAGGSPLLGVRGTVIITHGRARRRMIGFALDVAARTARERVPELISEALRAPTAVPTSSPTGAAAAPSPVGEEAAP